MTCIVCGLKYPTHYATVGRSVAGTQDTYVDDSKVAKYYEKYGLLSTATNGKYSSFIGLTFNGRNRAESQCLDHNNLPITEKLTEVV
jgi:hypothetical protein